MLFWIIALYLNPGKLTSVQSVSIHMHKPLVKSSALVILKGEPSLGSLLVAWPSTSYLKVPSSAT
jgi:hypothetical protein